MCLQHKSFLDHPFVEHRQGVQQLFPTIIGRKSGTNAFYMIKRDICYNSDKERENKLAFFLISVAPTNNLYANSIMHTKIELAIAYLAIHGALNTVPNVDRTVRHPNCTK